MKEIIAAMLERLSEEQLEIVLCFLRAYVGGKE